MLASETIRMIQLYQTHNVVITLSTGECVSGAFQAFDPVEQALKIDESFFNVSALEDIECLSRVTEYDPSSGDVQLDDGYHFSISQIADPALRDTLHYREYDCVLASHLKFEDGKIVVSDIRLASKARFLDMDVLTQKEHLYFLEDGSHVCGFLRAEESGSYYIDEIPIEAESICDITRLPCINDTVLVLLPDAKVLQGVVSAAQKDSIMVITNSSEFVNISLSDIKELRYQGEVTSMNSIDDQYECYSPYSLHDKNDSQQFFVGQKVFYRSGINCKGEIAKDIIFDNASARDSQKYYGVLLMVNLTKEDGMGYIGQCYTTKAYGEYPSGSVSFFRSQMNFPFAFGKAFIVSYTITPGSADQPIQSVAKMEKVDEIDTADLGKIEVDQNTGEVIKTPLFKACTRWYMRHEVEVVCNDDTCHTGILSACDSDTITLSCGTGDQAIKETLAFSDIQSIQIIGSITAYWPNGTGRVDNTFFFHVNDLEEQSDAQYIQRGAQVIFTLENSPKGNGLICKHLKVLKRSFKEVYVLDHTSEGYKVVDKSAYGASLDFEKSAYVIPYLGPNQFKDIETEDYHAVFSFQRKAGIDVCSSVRIISPLPKLKAGIVTAFDRGAMSITIAPPDQLEQPLAEQEYRILNILGISKMSEISMFNYEVLYTLHNQNGITLVDISKILATQDKYYFGYLRHYYVRDDKGFGFIIPEEHIQDTSSDFDVYCPQFTFVNAPDTEDLLGLSTSNQMYYVRYTVNFYRKISGKAAPAKKVWFINKVSRSDFLPQPRPKPQLPTQTNPPQTNVSFDKTSIYLSAEYPVSTANEKQYDFGIVRAYDQKFDYLHISKEYTNKAFLNCFTSVPEKPLSVPVDNVQIYSTDPINTFDFIYLVRYAYCITEDGTKLIDTTDPVEFLRAFSKSDIAKVSVQDDVLTQLTPPAAPEPAQSQIEKIPLAEYAVENERFGFLGFCTNTYGRIFPAYQPKYSGDPNGFVAFFTNKVRFSTETRPKSTATIVYLVRYRQEGTEINPSDGKEYPTVAEGSTITIIGEYRKKYIKRLSFSEDGLWLIREHYSEFKPFEPGALPGNTPSKVDDLLPRETVLLQSADNSDFEFAVCEKEDQRYALIGRDGQMVDMCDTLQHRLWRFGCITNFDLQSGLAQMNDLWTFHANSMKGALYNIVKAQVSSWQGLTGVYCLFSCTDGIISEVVRIRDVYRYVPWEKGTISSIDITLPYFKLQMNENDLIHRRSVETDPYLIPQIKGGEISPGNPIWARKIAMAWSSDSDETIRLKEEAIEIHAVEQFPTIQYNTHLFKYLAYENSTYFYPVLASESVLRTLCGKKTSVVFEPSFDGFELEAKIREYGTEESDDEEPESSSNSTNLESLPLFQTYLDKVGLSQTGLKEISATEEDLPTRDEASRTFNRLIAVNRPAYPVQPKLQLVAAKIALAYPQLVKQNPSVNTLLLGVLRMTVRNIARQSDTNYGELAYGLSLLLRYDPRNKDVDYSVWLLLLDFGSSLEIKNYESDLRNLSLSDLLNNSTKPLTDRKMHVLISHLMTMPMSALESVGGVLETHADLALKIRNAIITFDETLSNCEAITEMLHKLSVQSDRAFTDYAARIAEACTKQIGKASSIADIIGEMNSYWLKLTDNDDCERFLSLKKACDKFTGYSRLASFVLQERELFDAWTITDTIERLCWSCPCHRSTEILLQNPAFETPGQVFTCIKDEISDKLNRLYNEESLPTLTCKLNEESLTVNSFRRDDDDYCADIQIIIQNGDIRQPLQPAENICIELESLTAGVSVPPQIFLDHPLSAGDEDSVTVQLRVYDQSILDSINDIELQWNASFYYTDSFLAGHAEQKKFSFDSKDTLTVQLVTTSTAVKRVPAKNPYHKAAEGKPLEADSPIYQRRIEENMILRTIRKVMPDGTEEFRPGKTVMLYGQKKSGKTSLINQIKAYISKSDSLREKAIIIDFNSLLSNIGGVTTIRNSFFIEAFCDNILDKFRLALDSHEDVWELIENNNLEIPQEITRDPRTAFNDFMKFFRAFNQVDQGKHTILLFMDEFTTLCSTLVNEIRSEQIRAAQNNMEVDPARINEIQHIPDFVKNFSDLGFIQVIIGHEAMLRSLDCLGMNNQTSEFAYRVELTVLKPSEAEALIREPMKTVFGYDPYQTPLGNKAVAYMMEASGCHPTFLVRICKEIFDFYVDVNRCPAEQTNLFYSQVSDVIRNYITSLQPSAFDILLLEDGDTYVNKPEERPTYRYLTCIAKLSLESGGNQMSADSGVVFEAMKQELGEIEAEQTRNILQSRHVISYTSGGRVQIETGMFREFIKQRHGIKEC